MSTKHHHHIDLTKPCGEHPSCSKCGYFSHNKHPFIVDGVHWVNGKAIPGFPNVKDPIAVVIDAPDEHASNIGSLVGSPALKELRDFLHTNFPYLMDRLWVTSAMGCTPYSTAKLTGEIVLSRAGDKNVELCNSFLHNQLAALRPAAIIALGAVACQATVGRKDVLSLAGRVYNTRVEVPDTTRLVHVNKHPYDVYIGRAMVNRLDLKAEGWGNPWPVDSDAYVSNIKFLGEKSVAKLKLKGDEGTFKVTRPLAVEMYGNYLPTEPELMARLPELKNKRLACWCEEGELCHGHALIDAVKKHVPNEVIEIPTFPLWALGYARGESRMMVQYLEMWTTTLTLVDSPDRAAVTTETDSKKQVDYEIAHTPEEVEAWFNQMIDHLDIPLAWDVETTSVMPWCNDFQIFLFSFYHDKCARPLLVPVNYPKYYEYVGWDMNDATVASRVRANEAGMLEIIRAVIESGKIQKFGHNVKFDQNAVVAKYGWKVRGFLTDTQVLEYCIDPNTQGFRGLDDLVRKYMPKVGEYWAALDRYKEQHPDHNYSQIPCDIMLPYAANDTAILPRMLDIMIKRLEKLAASRHGGWFVRAGVDQPATRTYSIIEYALYGRRVHHLMACEIEQNGIVVDRELAGRLKEHYTNVAEEIRQQLSEHPQVRDFEQNRLLDVMAETTRKEWIRKTAFKIIPDLKPRTPLKKFKDQVLASKERPQVNWNSTPQLVKFFVDYLQCPVTKLTDAGAPSTDAESLQEWGSDGCEPALLLLEFREFDKFLTSYINPLMDNDPKDRILHDDGMLHPSLNVTGPRTGRLSANNPNVQAMPRDGLVKRLYKSRFHNGWILQRDYSGLEVRVLAIKSRDPSLVEAFMTGGDPHFRTQQHFFKEAANKSNKSQRSVCKQTLFGRIYGQGDNGLFALLRKNKVLSPHTGEKITIEECQEFNLQIDALYPMVVDWVELAHAQAIQKKWTCSAFGFTIPFPVLAFYDRYLKERWTNKRLGAEVSQALRQSQNYPIQSTASDITTFACYRIIQKFKKAGLAAKVVLIVHDSIYVDCPDDEVLVASRIMHDVMDNVSEWLPELLPGFDASWMNVPIIGEMEVGINAKDALVATEELTEKDPSKQLILKTPDIKEDDGRYNAFKRIFGDASKVNWSDARTEIREWLEMQRFVFK